MGNLQLNTQSPGALTETLKSIKLQINPISLAIWNKQSNSNTDDLCLVGI